MASSNGHQDCALETRISLADQSLGTISLLSEDKKDSAGLLQVWWGSMQDQIGAVKGEIASLRTTISQLQARLSETVLHWKECSGVLSQVAEEQKVFRSNLETEREARSSTLDQASEALKAEVVEFQRKFSMALVDEQQSRNSCLVMLHSQVAALSSELATERDESAKRETSRRNELHTNLTTWFLEQQDCHQKSIMEHITAEMTARDQQLQKVSSQKVSMESIRNEMNELRAASAQMISDRLGSQKVSVESIKNEMDELRASFDQMISDRQGPQKVSAETIKKDMDELRAAFAQMISDTTNRLEMSRADINKLQKNSSFRSCRNAAFI